MEYFTNEISLYHSIKNGYKYSEKDKIIPTRDDFVSVYSLLRSEYRIGNDMMREIEIYHKLSRNKDVDIRLAKLKIILDIMNELNICAIEEVSPGIYQYEIYFNSEKTNIEKSSILRKIKNQCIKDYGN